jgi:hypothetical protein
MVQRAALSSPARAFLRELVYGVLRWRTRLDWFLGQCSARPLDTLTAPTRNLLRLGAYQLCMMDHIPSYAAVNETVRVAKQVGHAGVVAFVNAVLRALERQRRSLRLPERETDLMGYLTITEAHPRWLIDRWLPRPVRSLGTDGFGRSDTRDALRRHFEVNAHHIVVATLAALARAGDVKREAVTDAIKRYEIDAEAINPLLA